MKPNNDSRLFHRLHLISRLTAPASPRGKALNGASSQQRSKTTGIVQYFIVTSVSDQAHQAFPWRGRCHEVTDEVERHCCNLPCRQATVLFIRQAKRKPPSFHGCFTAYTSSVAYRRQLPLQGKPCRREPPAGESPERDAVNRQS